MSPEQQHRCTVQTAADGSPYLAFEPSGGTISSYSNSLFTLDLQSDVSLADARDLAEWIVRMVETRTAGTFNATGPARAFTTRQLLDGVAKGVGATPRYTWVASPWLAQQKVNGWTDLPVWLPGDGATGGFHRRSIAAALRAGLTYRPLATTARDTLAWWNTLPEDRRAKPRTGLTAEREAELLKGWKSRT